MLPSFSRHVLLNEVALRVDLDSTLGNARLTDDAPVLRKYICVRLRAELVEELRRALDVREEECDSARR